MSTDDGSIPVANRKSTIFGVIIALQILATLAVSLRLYTRLKLVKSPGWDDAAICMALASVTLGTIFSCLSVRWGLGQHMTSLSPGDFEMYLKRFYVASGSYIFSTTFIKLSLLLQYLRVYDTGTMRKVCFTLICLISAWGLAFNFMAWVPCFPVRAYWDWSITDARCYAFGGSAEQRRLSSPKLISSAHTGAKTKVPFRAAYVSHATLNLLFDLAVLVCAMPAVPRKDRSRREQIALIGLLTVGTWIVVVSAWRLGTIIAHGAGWGGPDEATDFTWFSPEPVILSAVEVVTAILAASMPIFWPVMEAKLLSVFVTHEIVITHQPYDAHGFELNRSSSQGSERSLNRTALDKAAQYYRSPHLQGYVDPFKTEEQIHITQCGQTARLAEPNTSRYETID